MVEFEQNQTRTPRIQWTDADIEAGGRRPSLHRTNSNISINSTRSRRASIDPASALPIAYRTVSYQIAESKEKSAAETQKVKDSAAKGKPNHPS
jgi:sodium/potassium-transporting ATPase subunit alpha